MKVAILLPGYLDSPDYTHMMIFESRLVNLGYIVERLDLGDLWKTGRTDNYTITNFLKQIKKKVGYYVNNNPEEIVLIGHSDGGLVSIIAGSRIDGVSRIVAFCPPPDTTANAKKWVDKKDRVSKRDLPKNKNKYKEFSIPYSYVEDSLKYSAVNEVKNINKPLMIFIALDDNVNNPNDTEKIVKNTKGSCVIRQRGVDHNFRKYPTQCDIVMNHLENFLINK